MLKINRIIEGMVVLLLLGCSSPEKHACIKPLPKRVWMSAYMDADYAVSLRTSDFDFDRGTVSLAIYTMELYDAGGVQNMHVGDTLLYSKDTLIVSHLADVGDGLAVNGGMKEGGCWLLPSEGNTYKIMQREDHALYTIFDTPTLSLAPFFTLVDCGENATDPSRVINAKHQSYLLNLPENRQVFLCRNTRVLIKNGMVTHIIRKWISE